jgi:hypothetical protein
MDDSNLTGEMEEDLKNRCKQSKTFSGRILMEFGLDRRAEIVLKKGKLVQSKTE